MNPDDDTGLEFAFRNDAFLAQMVERWPFKPMVVGSIPTEGVCRFSIVVIAPAS